MAVLASGPPSEDHIVIFNGDFIDRGAFGLEVLMLLLALKIALPGCVHLNRGNHEVSYSQPRTLTQPLKVYVRLSQTQLLSLTQTLILPIVIFILIRPRRKRAVSMIH